jgi:hypothetical protein
MPTEKQSRYLCIYGDSVGNEAMKRKSEMFEGPEAWKRFESAIKLIHMDRRNPPSVKELKLLYQSSKQSGNL